MSAFEDGYRAFLKNAGVNLSTFGGADFVDNVENAIIELGKISLSEDGRDIDILKGVAAEFWHEGTFNILALIKGVKIRATAPNDNGIADIFLSNGSKIQSKYFKTPEASAKQQSKTLSERYNEYCSAYRRKHNGANPEKTLEQYVSEYNKKNDAQLNQDSPYYDGQVRLVPADQLKEAEDWLRRKIAENANNRPELVERYQDALNKLSDRVKGGGAESIPLDEKTAKEIAKQMKEDGFNPEDFGLTTDELIGWDDIMRQANQAGLSAALISVVLEVAPMLLEIISKALRHDDINADDFKRLGFSAFRGTTLGYIRGNVAAAITVSCKKGCLGATLKAVDPVSIGAVVAITMNTLQNATIMAFGQMTKQEFANRCILDLFTTSCSLGFGLAMKAIFSKFAGVAVQSLLPHLPVLGYMLGSFIGGVIGAFAYQATHYCVMSYCVESGCTFFGLVTQDYTLPNEILEELGLEVFEYESFGYEKFEYANFEHESFEYEAFKYEPINICKIRRGVIGVNAVGFVI